MILNEKWHYGNTFDIVLYRMKQDTKFCVCVHVYMFVQYEKCSSMYGNLLERTYNNENSYAKVWNYLTFPPFFICKI